MKTFIAASIVLLLVAVHPTPAKPVAVQNHVKVTVVVNGDSETNSHFSLRWGHTDFHEHEYFERWDVAKGTQDTKEFDVSDDRTEFEIQTQGGKVTGYSMIVEIDGKKAITCKFNARPDASTEFTNHGVVQTIRSSDVNAFGEGNLRVIFNGKPNPGPIPSKAQ